VRRAQLGESMTTPPRDVGTLDCLGDQVDDLVVSTEVGEMLERQVDRTSNHACGTQVSKLVELSFTAGHVPTIRPRADAPLHSD
jgi:hypothetical protein